MAGSSRSIFLSHSSVDKAFAARLGARLTQVGVKVWLDKAEIKPGDSLSEKIGEALGEIDAICVVLSPDAAVSEWVAKEIRLARRRYKQLKNIKLIPLIYRTTKVPRSLSDRLFIDFSDQANFDLALGHLLEALNVFPPPSQDWTDEEVGAQIRQLGSGFALLHSLAKEAEEQGGITIATTKGLRRSRIPSVFIDQFLLLLAMRYAGSVRFGVALTAAELVMQTGIGRPALEYCLTGDRLSREKRHSVAYNFLSDCDDLDVLVYVHHLFVRYIAEDAIYYRLIAKHFDAFRSACYDEMRSYLLNPDRGPKSLNWDSLFLIIKRDPDAVDFKQRIIDWINDGQFEKPENNVAVGLYKYLNRVDSEQIQHLGFLSDMLIDRLEGMLKSTEYIAAVIYHLSAMCVADYVRLRPDILNLLANRYHSAEAALWPETGKKLLFLFRMYIEALSKQHDDEERRHYRAEITQVIKDHGEFQVVGEW